jgi:hypothetical protein
MDEEDDDVGKDEEDVEVDVDDDETKEDTLVTCCPFTSFSCLIPCSIPCLLVTNLR